MPTPNVDRYAADKLRKSDHAVTRITAAGSINPGEEDVVVVVPLATANKYDVYLPPVGSCPGARFFIRAERAAGSYVDGGVTVKELGDSILATPYASAALTANDDYLVIDNVAGKLWVEADELTST